MMTELLRTPASNSYQDPLQELIQQGAFLVDVRSPQEYAEGHVPGSFNIPLDQLENQLEKFKDKSSIIVFCRSGGRSSMAKAVLEQNGFSNVFNGGTWENINRLIR